MVLSNVHKLQPALRSLVQSSTHGLHRRLLARDGQSKGLGMILNSSIESLEKRHNSSSNVTHQPIEDFLDVKIETKDNVTYVEGTVVPTGRQEKLVKVEGSSDACALCRLNLKNLNYTDVMILSQWVKKNGTMATYEESKLCTRQYLRVKNLISQAQRCNLMARPADYLVPGAWHDLNTYLERDRRRDQPMKVIKKEYWKI